MPVYVWRCSGCDRVDEVVVPWSHAEIARSTPRICVDCENVIMTRVSTAAALAFKGAGWTGKSSGGRKV